MESFFSDLLLDTISYWAESHLESSQKSPMEVLCENSQRPQHIDYFQKKAQAQMFDWILNEPSTGCAVNVGCR